MSRSVRDPESIRERQARSQEPAMSGVAEVLAKHRIDHRHDTTLHEQCICGRRWMMGPLAFEAHQAAMLTASGVGSFEEPVMTEWEIAARRAIHECDRQITADEASPRRIKTILEGGNA